MKSGISFQSLQQPLSPLIGQPTLLQVHSCSKSQRNRRWDNRNTSARKHTDSLSWQVSRKLTPYWPLTQRSSCNSCARAAAPRSPIRRLQLRVMRRRPPIPLNCGWRYLSDSAHAVPCLCIPWYWAKVQGIAFNSFSWALNLRQIVFTCIIKPT